MFIAFPVHIIPVLYKILHVNNHQMSVATGAIKEQRLDGTGSIGDSDI